MLRDEVRLLCDCLWRIIAATARLFLDLLLALWDVIHVRDPFLQNSIRLLKAKIEAGDLTERSDIRADAYMSLAYLFAEQGSKEGVQEYLQRARAGYNLAIDKLDKEKDTYKREPSPWTKQGILLSAPLYESQNLADAFAMFDKANGQGCQHAVYWKGRALLNGFGVKRDAKKGLELIQQAAATGVLRAKLEIATLFEEGFDCKGCDGKGCDCKGCECNGCDGCDCKGCDCKGCVCIRKNPAMAEAYYRAISLTPRGKEVVAESLDYERVFKKKPDQLDDAAPIDAELADQEWVRDVALSHLLKVNELLDKEDAMGQSNGSLLSWEFAGQAFLFAAAASLSSSSFNGSESYDLLTHFIPIIGIAIGIISFFSSCSSALKNAFRRHDLGSMFEAKVDACERLTAHPQLGTIWWESGIFLQTSLAKFSDWCAVGLSLLFIGVWTKLYIAWEY